MNNQIIDLYKSKKKHLQLLLVIFCLSCVSILVTLLLFKLLPKFNQFASSCHVPIPLKIGHSSIPIHHNFNFWFISCIASSVVFFICLSIANNWAKSLREGQLDKKDNKKKMILNTLRVFIVGILLGFLKDICWAITIKINSYFGYKQATIHVMLFTAAALLACAIFLQFHNFLMARSIFKPIGENSQIAQKKELSKLEKVIAFIIKIITNSDVEKSNIDLKKFMQYMGILLLSCAIMGIPAFFARSISAILMRELVNKLKFLEMNWGFNLNGKFVQIINNQNAMLFICIFDCICLIAFTYIIHRFSIWLYTKSCISKEKQEEYQEKLNSTNEKLKKGKDIFEKLLKTYCPQEKPKVESKWRFLFKIFLPSVIMALFFHMITQVQKSILDYGHNSWISMVILGSLLVVMLTLCLVSNLYLNGTFSGLNDVKVIDTLTADLVGQIKKIECEKHTGCCNESCLCSCCVSKLDKFVEPSDNNEGVKEKITNLLQLILMEINNGKSTGQNIQVKINNNNEIEIFEMGQIKESGGRCPCAGSAGKIFDVKSDNVLSSYLELENSKNNVAYSFVCHK